MFDKQVSSKSQYELSLIVTHLFDEHVHRQFRLGESMLPAPFPFYFPFLCSPLCDVRNGVFADLDVVTLCRALFRFIVHRFAMEQDCHVKVADVVVKGGSLLRSRIILVWLDCAWHSRAVGTK